MLRNLRPLSLGQVQVSEASRKESGHERSTDGVGQRNAVFAYTLACYVLHWIVLLYTIAFLLNLGVPKGVDASQPADLAIALLIDLLTSVVFAGVHWIKARDRFKTSRLRIVPAAMKRSTYVLISSILLALALYAWSPVPTIVWSIDNAIGKFLMLDCSARAGYWLLQLRFPSTTGTYSGCAKAKFTSSKCPGPSLRPVIPGLTG